MNDISNCISYMIGGAAKQISRRARELLAPYQVTPVQYAVLRALYEQDNRTGAELAAKLFMDSATLTGVLDRLEKQGLIARVPDPKDRRANRLRLQHPGLEMLPELDRAMDQLNKEADRILGTDATRIRAGLTRLSGRLE